MFVKDKLFNGECGVGKRKRGKRKEKSQLDCGMDAAVCGL
jgi:hypothetical protein